jgi:hypothetical protein
LHLQQFLELKKRLQKQALTTKRRIEGRRKALRKEDGSEYSRTTYDVIDEITRSFKKLGNFITAEPLE